MCVRIAPARTGVPVGIPGGSPDVGVAGLREGGAVGVELGWQALSSQDAPSRHGRNINFKVRRGVPLIGIVRGTHDVCSMCTERGGVDGRITPCQAAFIGF